MRKYSQILEEGIKKSTSASNFQLHHIFIWKSPTLDILVHVFHQVFHYQIAVTVINTINIYTVFQEPSCQSKGF